MRSMYSSIYIAIILRMKKEEEEEEEGDPREELVRRLIEYKIL